MLDALLSSATILSVGELTAYLRTLLLESPLQDVWVRGEVSNTSMSRNGHLFFSLKDESALVKCVVWSPASYRIKPDVVDGQEVAARGRLDLYPPQGVYQLYVEHVIPVGVGVAYLEFERVKRLLDAEGLFALERKRALPRFPARVGVVTSARGAALRDIQNVMSRRWPAAELVLAHASVQGEAAPQEIVAALQSVCRQGVDVVIVARGGGAKEDLSCFNDERVARAIAAAPVPVVTGVGHETDFTIADFVADLRAPTPSAAAAAVVPDRDEIADDVAGLAYRLATTQARELERRGSLVAAAARSLWRASPQYALAMSEHTLDALTARLQHAQAMRLEARRQAVGALAGRLRLVAPTVVAQRAQLAAAATALHVAVAARLRQADGRVGSTAGRLATLDPTATLSRGYAIVRRRDLFASVVTSARGLEKGAPLDVQFADGVVPADVVGSARTDYRARRGNRGASSQEDEERSRG
jgi:exodeoxyribonuclease VII large subunit